MKIYFLGFYNSSFYTVSKIYTWPFKQKWPKRDVVMNYFAIKICPEKFGFLGITFLGALFTEVKCGFLKSVYSKMTDFFYTQFEYRIKTYSNKNKFNILEGSKITCCELKGQQCYRLSTAERFETRFLWSDLRFSLPFQFLGKTSGRQKHWTL